MLKPLTAALATVLLAACASGPPRADAPASNAARPSFTDDPYASTYRRLAAPPVLVSGATVLDGNGGRLDGADVLMADGRIVAVGTGLDVPADAVRVDGRGKWVTPGIIDVHSHLGVYPSPGMSAHSDGNEATAPVTAAVWAEHSVWPQDPGFAAALAGGVTDAADPARLGQPGRRARGHAPQRAGHHLPGDEVPRRALGPEDGLWREPQARLRPEGRPGHAHG
jgi:hypothetical protein